MKAGARPIFILLLLFACPASAAEWVEVPELGPLFEDAGVEGTFVVFDPISRRHLGHDEARAGSRYVPASTFKIPHTLIGLNVGAVRTVDEVVGYGGRAQPFAAWERDMSLREAIAMSNAAIYQGLARRIGLADMHEQLGRLGYGNGETGAVIDRFWLDGPLAISAMEQIAFLNRLAKLELPLRPAIQRQVAAILLQRRTGDWGLWAKSGWENAPGAGVGWVGRLGPKRRDELSFCAEHRYQRSWRRLEAQRAGHGLPAGAGPGPGVRPDGTMTPDGAGSVECDPCA